MHLFRSPWRDALWKSVSFSVFAASVLVSVPSRASCDDWQYVTTDDAAFSTQFRLLPLDKSPPEDVTVRVEDTEHAGFAQIRYGSFDSRRTAIMIVPANDGARLYVDLNHDRHLSENECIESTRGEWTVSLAAEFVDGNMINSDDRQLRLRYAKGRLSAGAIGYLQGQVELEGQSVNVRRVDANANGQFADSVDQVWMDLNGDTKWNVFSERFPMMPFLRLHDVTYTCSTDLRGQRFALAKMEATGTIELSISDELRGRGLKKLSAVLAGNSGSIVHLNLVSGAIELPADEYRPVHLVATFERSEAPEVWSFEFVSGEVNDETVWTKVESNLTASIDPLHGLEFAVAVEGDQAYAAGTSIVIQPTLGHRQRGAQHTVAKLRANALFQFFL